MPADYPVTVNAVSRLLGRRQSMIEAYEAGTAPAFELYGLGLEHKHVPELQALRRPDAAADLRAVGRQLPAGHAGLDPAASRHAAGQAAAARPRAALDAHYRGADAGQRRARSRRPRPRGSSAEALNDTDKLELFVFGKAELSQAVLVARLDNLGKGAAGRRGAEHPADARPRRCGARSRPPLRRGRPRDRMEVQRGGGDDDRRAAPDARGRAAAARPPAASRCRSPSAPSTQAASRPAEPTMRSSSRRADQRHERARGRAPRRRRR